MPPPRKKIVTPLEWLESSAVPPHLTMLAGTDEWVIDLLLNSVKGALKIEDEEFGFAVLHSDDLTPEAAMDTLRGGSLLYGGTKLVFIRGTPSGRQDRLKKTLDQCVSSLDELTYVLWQVDEFDAAKRPKLYPYTLPVVQSSLVIRFDERNDDEMVLWTKHLLRKSELKLSANGIGQIADSAQLPFELNSIIEQLKVWADDNGKVSDEVFERLALGTINAVVEEVVLHLLSGNSEKMLAAIYRLDEQAVSKNATTILWRIGSILHECWYWLLPPATDAGQGNRWNPYLRLFQELTPRRKHITEVAVWETLSDLATLDTALKTTGSYQQEYRLLVQTLLPAVERFRAGTQRTVRA